MKILITNDDGIKAEGIARLAEYAKAFGEVYVVAPATQCSAMSHRLTVGRSLHVNPCEDFPVEGIAGAYSVDGTPADCVKAAMACIIPEKPDVVFSGINVGYNAGFDILYSGTVGAATDALIFGVPAIAYSAAKDSDYKLVEETFYSITKELLETEISTGEIWNVNFPAISPEECKGILRDRVPSKSEYYLGPYEVIEGEKKGTYELMPQEQKDRHAAEGTDVSALLDGYISIGKVSNGVL